jgi:hypothetical protein
MALGLLVVTDVAPTMTLEVEDSDKKNTVVPKPTYAAWIGRDQHVLGWLNSSVSPNILAHVLEKETTAEVWGTVTSLFSSASHSNVAALQTALNNTKKKEMSVAQYLTIVNGLCSKLASTRKNIKDDEVVGYILNDLNKSYNALVDRVSSNPWISLGDLFG